MIEHADVVGKQRDDVSCLSTCEEINRVLRDMQEQRVTDSLHDSFFETNRNHVAQVLHQASYEEQCEDHEADVAD